MTTKIIHLFNLSLMVCLISFISVEKVQAQNLPDNFQEKWQALVADHRQALKKEGIVGATIAFVYNGKIVATDYYGMEDLATNRPVDKHTIYHWASITKTFTAVGMMQLRDHGLIELSDPIVKYVPELWGVYDPYGSMKEITIRQLMSHTSGFRAASWPWQKHEYKKPWQPHEPTKWSQLVAMIPYTRILFKPGSKYSYSNLGFIFLGKTIERETGSEYESYIENNIFDLLGMYSAYFDTTPWHLKDDRSNNYRLINGQPVANGLDFNTGVTVSNGGLNCTVAAMAKWVSFLMDAPKSKQSLYSTILSHRSLEEMWTPVARVADSSTLGPVKIGLSFFLYHKNGHHIVGHTGGQMSFNTFIFLDPKANVGIIGAYNTAGGDETAPATGKIMTSVRAQALNKLFPLFWDE